MAETYDSTQDTLKHKKNVNKVMGVLLKEFLSRSVNHDNSKLEDPEKACYDKYIPMLKTEKYGTPAYLDIRKKMNEEGLDHHYKVNRHHPEHYENADISEMDLVDLVEMFVDHYASSLRSDTGYEKGEEMNSKRYKYSDQIYKIFMNTYDHYFK